MARLPDRPGQYRIREKPDGTVVLSGRKLDGTRVKVPGLSRGDANELAVKLFGANPVISVITLPQEQPSALPKLDDWGLPLKPVTAESLGNLGAAAGKPPATGSGPAAGTTDPKRAERNKQAQSLMELAGVAFAAGDCWLGRRMCEGLGKEPVKPNEKQVKDLAEVSKETFQGWFGDVEVKPWQMMILLGIGIPVSMILQSRPKPKEVQSPKQPTLQSVPSAPK